MRVKLLRVVAVLAMVVAGAVVMPPAASAATLPLPSLVVGVVTGQDTGLPLTGICVTVLGYAFNETGISALQHVSTKTVAGVYAVVIPQPVEVELTDCENVRKYAPVVQEIGGGPLPVVTARSTMPLGGSLVGTITDGSHSGAALAGGCAYDGGLLPVTADSGGHYAYADLPAGSSTLALYPCILNETDWQTCLSNNSYNYAMCDPLYQQSDLAWNLRTVTITAGSTTTANAELAVGGEVDGTVTTAGGQPAADDGVNIKGVSGGALPIGARLAITDAAGHYRFRGLPAGTYTFEFRHNAYNVLFATSGPVTVAPGQVVSGINATGAP